MARDFFPLTAAVFAVLRRDDRLLALRRSGTGWHDGYWSLPAGGHDGGEPLWAAAARELKEETGLIARPDDARLVHIQHNFTEGREWLGCYFAFETWTGEAVRGEPDKHDRVEWVRWVDIEASAIPYVRLALTGLAAGRTQSSFRDDGGKASS